MNTIIDTTKGINEGNFYSSLIKGDFISDLRKVFRSEIS